jgi:hypothetical protein
VFRLSGVVLDAKPEDFDMANAFLLGFDPVALCTDEEAQIVPNFIAALDEEKPVRVRFVRSGFGIVWNTRGRNGSRPVGSFCKRVRNREIKRDHFRRYSFETCIKFRYCRVIVYMIRKLFELA